jgi:hypothetical protein
LSFNQDLIGGGAELALQPGSGTLDWHFGYQIHATIFEDDTGKPYNNLVNEVYTRGRWKFRPRTALVYDATLRWFNYTNLALAQPVGIDNSTPVRTRLGLDGLVTDRFALLAMLGWGASFYQVTFPQQPQFDSLIAQAELRWFLAASPGIASVTDVGLALSSIAIGYTRDFQNSYLGSFYTQDRGYLKFYYLFAGRATITLEGGVAAIEYPNLYWSDGVLRQTAFNNVRADATLFGEYRFTDTFGLNATLRYTTNAGNQLLDVTEPVMGAAAPAKYALQWNRWEAYLGVRWFL